MKFLNQRIVLFFVFLLSSFQAIGGDNIQQIVMNFSQLTSQSLSESSMATKRLESGKPDKFLQSGVEKNYNPRKHAKKYKEGAGSSGGGDVVICSRPLNPFFAGNVFLADSFDLVKDGWLKFMPSKSEAELLKDSIRYLNLSERGLGDAIQQIILNRLAFVPDFKLEELDDDNISLDFFCEKKQLGVQSLETGIVRYDLTYFSMLQKWEKVLFIIHEAVISMVNSPGVDTTPVRKFVRNILMQNAVRSTPALVEIQGFRYFTDQTTYKEEWLVFRNRAHKTVWSTLMIAFQIESVFKDAGSINISDYEVWKFGNDKASLMMFAQTLTLWFEEFRGAKKMYPAVDYIQFIEKVLRYGLKNNKNTRWFADAMDDLYEFNDE